MQVPLIINPDNVLTLLKPYGKNLDLKINDIIKAEVLNVMESGDVSLRVNMKNGQSSIIVAQSDIALTKGMTVNFRVTASGAEIRLQFMGTASEGNRTVVNASETLPQKILRMLSEFAGSKLNKEDFRLMDEIFRALPDRLRAAFPQFRALEMLMPEIGNLNSEVLKKSVEGSGVLFETKLRLAVQEGSQEKLGSLLAGGDHKLELLKLKAALQDAQIISALQNAGLKPSEVEGMVDKLIRNLEFFQVTSHVNDAIYTFLPLAWQELKEGELSFKKGRDDRGDSYSCDINLDLEPAGRLSVSVALFEGSFFVTFYAEDQKLKDMINDGKCLLEQRFADAGLTLKVVNVTQKDNIAFGAKKSQGLTIKV